MKFYTFDELTYPDVPPEVGPEVRFTNRLDQFIVPDHRRDGRRLGGKRESFQHLVHDFLAGK